MLLSQAHHCYKFFSEFNCDGGQNCCDINWLALKSTNQGRFLSDVTLQFLSKLTAVSNYRETLSHDIQKLPSMPDFFLQCVQKHKKRKRKNRNAQKLTKGLFASPTTPYTLSSRALHQKQTRTNILLSLFDCLLHA